MSSWFQRVKQLVMRKNAQVPQCEAIFCTEKHPLCFRWRLLDPVPSAQVTLQTLLCLPLHWYWVSRPGCPCAGDPASGCTASMARSLTGLQQETLSLLLAELMEECDGYGREILLCGLHHPWSRAINLPNEVQKFLQTHPSTVRMAVLHIEDDPCDYLYLDPADEEVLSAWLPLLGIRISDELARFPYKRLGTASLDVRLPGLDELMVSEELLGNSEL